jgi:uncharacterized protein YraI
MTSHLVSKLAVAVTALLAFSIPSAFAAEATSTVNVRSGPGTNYAVVSHLSRGQSANVKQQKGSWCYVTKTGADGWVACRYLADGGDRYVRSPNVSLSFSFGVGRDRDYRPSRPHRDNDWDHHGDNDGSHGSWGGDNRPNHSGNSFGLNLN